MEAKSIKSIAVLTQNNDIGHVVGQHTNGKLIHEIKIAQLWFTGDPYDHYCGYDANGEMVFSINCLAPCEVIYF